MHKERNRQGRNNGIERCCFLFELKEKENDESSSARKSTTMVSQFGMLFSTIEWISNDQLFEEENVYLEKNMNENFCFYLAKHTEANCDDRVCLIGEESEWIHPIQERLFFE